MGTIQNIVDNLLRQSSEKEVVLSERFEETSVWLANEFELIRKIILKKPRGGGGGPMAATAGGDALSASATAMASGVPPQHNAFVPSSVVRQSLSGMPAAQSIFTSNFQSSSSVSASNFASDDGFGKRKSPEVASVNTSFSPDVKRSSYDMEKLANLAGLPTDLNKLKKEQLLYELESRGITNLSMKSYKKDLIDALKAALEAQFEGGNDDNNNVVADGIPKAKPSSMSGGQAIGSASSMFTNDSTLSNLTKAIPAANNDRMSANADLSSQLSSSSFLPSTTTSSSSMFTAQSQLSLHSSNNLTSANPFDTSSSSSIRKSSSLLQELRQNIIVTSSSIQGSEESDSSRKIRLESEFAARQQRHRDSHVMRLETSNGGGANANGDVVCKGSLLTEEMSMESPIKTSSIRECSSTPSHESGSNDGEGDGDGMVVSPGPPTERGGSGSNVWKHVASPVHTENETTSSTSSSIADLTKMDGEQPRPFALSTIPSLLQSGLQPQQSQQSQSYASMPSSSMLGFNQAPPPRYSDVIKESAVSGGDRDRFGGEVVIQSSTANQSNQSAAHVPIQLPSNSSSSSISTASSVFSSIAGALFKKAPAPAQVPPQNSNTAPQAASMKTSYQLAMEKKQTMQQQQQQQGTKPNKPESPPSKQSQKPVPSANTSTAIAGQYSTNSSNVVPVAQSTSSKIFGVFSKSTLLGGAQPASTTNKAPMTSANSTNSSSSNIINSNTNSSNSSSNSAKAFGASVHQPSQAAASNVRPAIGQQPLSQSNSHHHQSSNPLGSSSGSGSGSSNNSSFASSSSQANPHAAPMQKKGLFGPSSMVNPNNASTQAQMHMQMQNKVVVSNTNNSMNNSSSVSSNSSVSIMAKDQSAAAHSHPSSNAFNGQTSTNTKLASQSSSMASHPATTTVAVQQPVATAQSSLLSTSAYREPAGASKNMAIEQESEVQEDEYEIEDDSSDGSGTDEDDDAAQQKIPEWARGPKLRDALERQYGMTEGSVPMDPDSIFPEVQSCNLEEIFGAKGGKQGKKAYKDRSSSAHWDADSLTLVEKRTYRNQMGYQGQLTSI